MSDPDYTTDTQEFKTCTKCGESFPANADYFSVRTDTGKLRSRCRECERKRHRRYREENREKVRESQKRWREENPEKMQELHKRYYEANANKLREYSKCYREENPGKVREDIKRWKRANPEKVRENNKRYQKEHPEYGRAKDRNRRARKRNATGSHTAADVQLQITTQTDKRGRLRCWWCGKVIKDGVYHVDHIIPLARGGSNDAGNICIAHPKCNLSKHAKTPHELGRLF